MGKFLFNLLKFILAVLFFPVLYASLLSLRAQMSLYPSTYESYFFVYGVSAYVISYLFIYRFENFYTFGQNVVSKIFQFAAPVNELIAKIVPFYSILILLVYVLVISFLKIKLYDHYFLFFTGFASTMHLLMTAQQMHEEENVPFKPSYFFTMTVVSILFFCLVVLMLDGFAQEFTFPKYLSNVLDQSGKFYTEIIHLLAKKV